MRLEPDLDLWPQSIGSAANLSASFECRGASPVHLRPGKLDARVRRFLEMEPVVWLATVRPDGRPHIIPVWFWWDGSELLVFSKPDAVKVDNLRADPHLMLAVGDADSDFDVGLVEACAEVRATAVPVPAPMFDKYALWMSEIGLDTTTFIATYSQAIRIVPTRFLQWRGRTPRDPRPTGVERALPK